MVRGKQHARQYNTSQAVVFSGPLGKHCTSINQGIIHAAPRFNSFYQGRTRPFFMATDIESYPALLPGYAGAVQTTDHHVCKDMCTISFHGRT
jgi:hypothetical protein